MSQPDRIPQVEVAAGDDTLAIVIRHLEALCEADLITLSTLGQQTGWHVYLQPKGLTQLPDFGPPQDQNGSHTALVNTVLSINSR